LTYDPDGNLTFDLPGYLSDLLHYVWDAESRLACVYTGDLEHPQNGDWKLEFKYDYMGRRVEEKYSAYSGNSWQVSNDKWLRFVYDGWNPVLALKGQDNSPQYKFTWGLDLSGTIHGAGGIGGLLSCVSTGGEDVGTYWYFYDANGNVRQVLDGTDVSKLVAHYWYDPYGKVIDAQWDTGGPDRAFAWTNPFRFSTRWFDDETGLGCWPERYYSPRLGRWISRDPIGELGGLNTYGFVRNEPSSRVDFIGLLDNSTCTQCINGCMAFNGYPDEPYWRNVCRGMECGGVCGPPGPPLPPIPPGPPAPPALPSAPVRNACPGVSSPPKASQCLKCNGSPPGAICNSHAATATYFGFNMRCVCNCMPNNNKNNKLRSCLACMKEAGVGHWQAHMDCYAAVGASKIETGNEICWYCERCAVGFPANTICNCANSAGPPDDPWDIPLGG
jgi:RHS repeat-associated protein